MNNNPGAGLSGRNRGVSWFMRDPAEVAQDADIIEDRIDRTDWRSEIETTSQVSEEEWPEPYEDDYVEPDTPPMSLREIIRDGGMIPHQRDGRTAELSQERLDYATERHEKNTEKNEHLARVGMLAQGITALSDLFILNRKGNDPASVGQRHGVNLSNEAIAQIEAGNIVFEQELEAHYERMFRDAMLEERVDQMNTDMANQMKRENLAGQISDLREALEKAGEMDPFQEFYMNAALRSITAGDFDGADFYAQKAGVEIDFERGRANPIRPSGPQAGQIIGEDGQPLERTRADDLAIYDYDRLNSEIGRLQTRVNELGEAATESNPDVIRLQRLTEQRDALLENPFVQEHQVDQRYTQEYLPQVVAPRLISAMKGANPESPEYLQALREYIPIFRDRGASDEAIMAGLAANRVPGFYMEPRDTEQFIRSRAPEWERMYAESGHESTVTVITNELVNNGMPEADARMMAEDAANLMRGEEPAGSQDPSRPVRRPRAQAEPEPAPTITEISPDEARSIGTFEQDSTSIAQARSAEERQRIITEIESRMENLYNRDFVQAYIKYLTDNA